MEFKTGQKVKCKLRGKLEGGVIEGKRLDGYSVMFPGEELWSIPCLDIYPDDVEVVDVTDIRHQPHYEQFKIQPVVFIAENNLDFLTGNIIKYVLRHGKKDGLKDLEKAKHYLDMLIQKVSGQEVKP